MDKLDAFIQDAANDMMPWVVFFLLATALFFSFRLRFVQIRRSPEGLRETLKSRQTAKSGALAPLQAFLTSLAATIGVGNIVGVATAIVSGGPGALFWIWCYGFFAMATKFAEAALGLHYRVAVGESALAGPMYYLRDGLKSPALAWLFALTAGIGCLFTTPFTQPNSVANVLDTQLKEHQLSLGILAVGRHADRNQRARDRLLDRHSHLAGNRGRHQSRSAAPPRNSPHSRSRCTSSAA